MGDIGRFSLPVCWQRLEERGDSPLAMSLTGSKQSSTRTSTPPPTPPRLRVRAPRTLQQASTQTFLFLIVWTRHSASLSFVGSVCDALCPSVRFFMSVCTHLITIQCANGRYTCSLSSVLSPCPQSSEAVSGCVPLLQVPPLRAMSSCGHWRPASQTAISVLQRSWGSGLCSRGV